MQTALPVTNCLFYFNNIQLESHKVVWKLSIYCGKRGLQIGINDCIYWNRVWMLGLIKINQIKFYLCRWHLKFDLIDFEQQKSIQNSEITPQRLKICICVKQEVRKTHQLYLTYKVSLEEELSGLATQNLTPTPQ